MARGLLSKKRMKCKYIEHKAVFTDGNGVKREVIVTKRVPMDWPQAGISEKEYYEQQSRKNSGTKTAK